MERIDELRNQLRAKNDELKNLRNDYKIIMENYKSNLDAKRELRTEIKKLYAAFRELKNGQAKVEA